MWYSTNTGKIAVGGKVHLLDDSRHTICGAGGPRVARRARISPGVVTCKRCLIKAALRQAAEALAAKFGLGCPAITNADGVVQNYRAWLAVLERDVRDWVDLVYDPVSRAEQVDTTVHVFLLSFGIEQ